MNNIFIAENIGQIVTLKNFPIVTGYTIEQTMGQIGLSNFLMQNFEHGYDYKNRTPIVEIGGIYPLVNINVKMSGVFEIVKNIHYGFGTIYNEFTSISSIFNSWQMQEEFLASMVINSREAGFKKLFIQTMYGQRKMKEIVVSISLAKFGFTMVHDSAENLANILKEKNRTEENLLDLISTDSGINFLEYNLSSWVGEFDLDVNSQNSELFTDYILKKNYNDSNSSSNRFLKKLRSASLTDFRYSKSA